MLHRELRDDGRALRARVRYVRIATFLGGVSCRRDPNGPLGLTLVGRTITHPDELVSLAFAGAAPEDLPDALEAPTVDRMDAHRYRIAGSAREWILQATGAHLHREVAATFYSVVSPRAPPWSKRLFWRLVLTMAASPTGKRLLLALRRR